MKIPLYIIIIFFISCNSDSHNNNLSPKSIKTDSVKAALIGIWGGDDQDYPVWNITQDSIYYFDRNKSYAYNIIGKDLIIKFPESDGHLREISVIQDTMIFYDAPGLPIKAYRIKPKK